MNLSFSSLEILSLSSLWLNVLMDAMYINLKVTISLRGLIFSFFFFYFCVFFLLAVFQAINNTKNAEQYTRKDKI